jgi:hypothetical protein
MAISKREQLELAKLFEKKHLQNVQKVLDEIIQLMEKGGTKTAYLAARRKLANNKSLPNDVKRAIDKVVEVFQADAARAIVKGIIRSKRLANEKNKRMTDSSVGRNAPKSRMQISTRRESLKRRPPTAPKNTVAARFETRFKDRQLSARVWKLAKTYKKALSTTIKKGLEDGTGSKQLAKDLIRNLRNPEGKINPGQGVYKSPRKNAERLTRTEINMAYEYEDYNRWQQLWFVVGIEIRLSAQHPKYDICDSLIGIYPKDFLFCGWHPHCLCIAVPILAPQDVRDAMMDYDLGLTNKRPDVDYIQVIPEAAKNYMSDNAERIKGWKNTPLFIQYNDKYLGDYMRNP